MIINYNVSSMIANNALKRNDTALSKSLERLSSGYKINHAKENAAGLAMARRMNAQLRGISTAGENAGDGVSVIEIADGALNEIHDMLQRMNELAIKAANGNLTDDDRAMVDEEVQALKDEIERIGETTQFNGQDLLDGTFDLKAYSNNAGVSVDYYSDTMDLGVYTITSITSTVDADGFLDNVDIQGLKYPNGEDVENYKVEWSYDQAIVTTEGGFEMKLTLTERNLTDLELDLTGMASMTLQVGSNEGQTLEVRIPPITKKSVGILYTNTRTEEASTAAIGEISKAISFVSSVRSDLGAYQNRLERTITNLDVTYENMTSAYSRVMDVDMATEFTNYSSLQILTQAATSMLAQANERPAQVLQLLQ
ncbi:MAG: flagellin FliC3 [Lachnospiraceae bacterium]|nr:flagellin FliC3 [Lachnospiraceae bacterium]